MLLFQKVFKKFLKLRIETLGTFFALKRVIKLSGDIYNLKLLKLRPVPPAGRESDASEVNLLGKQDILPPYIKSKWAHIMVTVSKADNGVRITTEWVPPNQFVISDRFHLPHFNEVFLDLNGENFFSNMDFRQGYYHVMLAPWSRRLTTMITTQPTYSLKSFQPDPKHLHAIAEVSALKTVKQLQ